MNSVFEFDEISQITKTTEKAEELNTNILKTITKRVHSIIGVDSLIGLYGLGFLALYYKDLEYLQKEMNAYKKYYVKNLVKMLDETAFNTYNSLKPYYDYRGITFEEFQDNKEIRSAYINAKLEILQRANKLDTLYYDCGKFYRMQVQDVYKDLIERTKYQQTLDKVSKSILYNLPKSNLKCDGMRLSTYVRNSMLNATKDVQQLIFDIASIQYKADGKILSIHTHPAKDHEPIQGHMFTNDEYAKLNDGVAFEDVEHHSFEPIARGIGEYNCRHYARGVILEKDLPSYNLDRANYIIKQNHKGVIINGNTYTLHDYFAQKRIYENKLQTLSNNMLVASKLGDTNAMQTYGTKMSDLYNIYSDYCSILGLKPYKY